MTAPESLDESHYRDDILRLLFVCGHPIARDSADRARTAHRVRTHRRTDCESLPGVSRRDGAADHARQTNHRQGRRRIRDARPRRTSRATNGGLDDDLSHLQRGVRKHPGIAAARAALEDEAIRLGRLLLRLFPTEPEVFGLLALMLLQQSRAPARFDANGEIVLLDEQDRSRWNQCSSMKGGCCSKEPPSVRPRAPINSRRPSRRCISTRRHRRIPRGNKSTSLYQALETMQPSPVVTLNRAVAVWKLQGPEAALADDRSVEERAGCLLLFPRTPRHLAQGAAADSTRHGKR